MVFRTGSAALRTCGAALLALHAAAAHASGDDLSPFPAPQAGQQRYVIRLEALPDEDRHRVELLVGRTIDVDCNRQRFIGELTRGVVDGWGYPYWAVDDVRGPAGTMMACPDGSAKRAFVTLGAEPDPVRYNSRLPLVVYVPQGFEVRYRLWTADDAAREAVAE